MYTPSIKKLVKNSCNLMKISSKVFANLCHKEPFINYVDEQEGTEGEGSIILKNMSTWFANVPKVFNK